MRIDDFSLSWPLLTVDLAALEHNIARVAEVFTDAGVEFAPHVKTHMSTGIYRRQAAAGTWGATVATPGQLREVVWWGKVGLRTRVLLANELTDPREIRWLRDALDAGEVQEAWVYVDSSEGVALLDTAFAEAVFPERLGVLVEVGVPGGRTGVRSVAQVAALARQVTQAGLRLVGVAGYEGPVASGTSDAELEAVAGWCADLRAAGARVAGLVDGEVVLSAGGSAFADVVLRELTTPLTDPAGAAVATRVVLRSGAYVAHDHGHYRRTDPWRRLGAGPLRPALTVWGQVLSVPEPGLVICGVGRRDASSDIDLPTPLTVRTVDDGGRLGAARDLPDGWGEVTALNDQHAFVRVGAVAAREICPGDVVGFGISHPCTTFQLYRTAYLVDGDEIVEPLQLAFH
ncbi:alanine racemase [Myceligenerans xiligouense]|uniref:D-serine deaminase-like pyridoxal phosphate-dependent protein n=1 Tax=Myceligenerans xiligouense TaxID=253184 RepID=A0A3N4YSD1_9MICO|nr:alanine racemase [Myceligenerans xiligouense]RPF22416.1 D-serine deaminase-like pyridoxal phosphate-dependent protein [Myceligenerans xiligouense]